MADRQQFTKTVEPDPELKKVMEASQNVPVTEELREQRMSFAFGLCHGQYDVTELALEPPQSPCSAAPAVEQNQRAECNGEQKGE